MMTRRQTDLHLHLQTYGLARVECRGHESSRWSPPSLEGIRCHLEATENKSPMRSPHRFERLRLFLPLKPLLSVETASVISAIQTLWRDKDKLLWLTIEGRR